MCGGGQDYCLYLRETGRTIQRRVSNPFARTALELAQNTGSVRAVQILGRLLEQRPFSSEEQMYRAITHLQGWVPKAEATRLLNQIIGASGERVEQVLEQIEIMCGRGMLDGNEKQILERLRQILNAVRSDRVFPDLAVANLRKSLETPTA